MARTTSSDAIGRIAVYARQLGLDISELDLHDLGQFQAAHERISSAIHELLFGPEDKPQPQPVRLRERAELLAEELEATWKTAEVVRAYIGTTIADRLAGLVATRPSRERVQTAIRDQLGDMDPGAVLTGRAADAVLAQFGAESVSAAPEPGTQLHLPPEPPLGTIVELRGNPHLAERWRCQRVVDDLRWVKQNSSTGEARVLSWPGLWRRALDGVIHGGQGDFTRHMVVVPEPEPVTVGTVLGEPEDVRRCPLGTWVVDSERNHGVVVGDGTSDPAERRVLFPEHHGLRRYWPMTVKGLPE